MAPRRNALCTIALAIACASASLLVVAADAPPRVRGASASAEDTMIVSTAGRAAAHDAATEAAPRRLATMTMNVPPIGSLDAVTGVVTGLPGPATDFKVSSCSRCSSRVTWRRSSQNQRVNPRVIS